jgi:glutaconate CoA-transferase subunit A
VSRDVRASLAEAASLVQDGDRIGFGGNAGLWRRPIAFVRELIRQERKGLHGYGVLSGLDLDMLAGAGALASTNTSYAGLDELGQGPNFQRAAVSGAIEANEWTEWTITAAFRAANMSLSYMPWRTAEHSDVAVDRGWKRVTCPYTGVEQLAIPAANLDVAVIQAVRADAAGNTELAVPLDFIYDVDGLIARSAAKVIVCAEEVGEIDPTRAQLMAREVDAVVEVPKGGSPGGFSPLYGIDYGHMLDEYIPAASGDDFAGYLERHVMGVTA